MLHPPPPPPLAARVEAGAPITGHLVAAAAGQPLALADAFLTSWLTCVRAATEAGIVIVFDEFVVGRPDPLLLEAAHHLRVVRRAQHLGHFDDEEDEWYDEHADDPDAVWDPPTLPERAIELMRHGQESERLLDGPRFDRLVHRFVGADPVDWLALFRIARTLERLVTELADAIRVGGAVPVDGRLLGERVDGLRWAA